MTLWWVRCIVRRFGIFMLLGMMMVKAVDHEVGWVLADAAMLAWLSVGLQFEQDDKPSTNPQRQEERDGK